MINPLPASMKQRGPTCGFYATRYVTDFYHLLDTEKYTTLPARRKDVKPQANVSYRSIAKQSGITGTGGIWDVNQFQKFVLDYNVDIATFESEEKMSEILLHHLHLNKPVIITVDMSGQDVKGETTVGDTSGGEHAHYVVITGYYKGEAGDLNFIFNTWNNYMHASAQEIFSSSNSLIKHNAQTQYKFPGRSWTVLDASKDKDFGQACKRDEKIKLAELPDIDLQYIRNKCVIMSPKNFNAIAHYSESLKRFLLETKHTNIASMFSLIQSGGKIHSDIAKTFPFVIHENMSEDDLNNNLNKIYAWKEEKEFKQKREMLFKYIADANANAAMHLLETNAITALSTYAAVTTVSGNTYENLSALVLAYVLDDVDMCKIILRAISKIAKRDKSNHEVAEAIANIYDQLVKKMAEVEAQKKQFKPYDFSVLVNAITKDEALLEGMKAGKNVEQEWVKFKEDFKPQVIHQGRSLIKEQLNAAEQVFNENLTSWNEKQKLWYLINVIGFMQTRVEKSCEYELSQGIKEVVGTQKQARRCNKLVIPIKNSHGNFRQTYDGKYLLGRDYYIEIFDGSPVHEASRNYNPMQEKQGGKMLMKFTDRKSTRMIEVKEKLEECVNFFRVQNTGYSVCAHISFFGRSEPTQKKQITNTSPESAGCTPKKI